MRGDVEIHLRQRDWDAHGHGDDPNYNGVVVHGVLEPGEAETSLHSGSSTPVVSLEGLLDGEDGAGAGELSNELHNDQYSQEVTSRLWGMLARSGYPRPSSDEELGKLLDRAGDERFTRKGGHTGAVRRRAVSGADAVRGPDGGPGLPQ